MSLFIADADARQAILEAAKLPSDCGTLVLKYIALFTPDKRHLTMDRAARLIREVCNMISAGAEYRGAELKAPSHVWRAALIEMLDRTDLKRPLRNHNYLKAVVASKLSERVDISQAEQHQARRGEARVNTGPQRMSDVLAKPVQTSLPKLPEDERECRLSAARELLVSEGFNERFLAAPLIEQKAREMYAEEVAQ